MAIKDVFFIRKYQDKNDEEKTDWTKVGICFGTNKDGSQNFIFNIPMLVQPGQSFQLREREEKDESGFE